VPNVSTIFKAPVAWGPKKTYFWSFNPNAGNPVIIVVSPGPVAGLPKIPIARTEGLFVFDKRRGRNRY
jgi:hypothetical protein